MRNPQAAGPVRQALSRRAVQVVLGLMILGGLVLAALPHAIGYGLTRWLTGLGAERVDLKDTDFNPFTGRLALKGLVVVVDGTPILDLREGVVRVDWLPLFRHRVQVRSLTLEGVEAVVTQRPDGTWKAPVLPPSPAPAAPSASGPPSPPWGFAVDGAELSAVRVHYRTPHENHVVQVDKASLADLATWRPDRPAHLSVSGALDEGKVQVSADVTPFAAAPKATGQVRVNDLDLGTFRALAVAPVSAVQGRLGLDLQVTAERRDGGFEVRDEGTVTLDAAGADADGRTVRAERLAWSGKAHLSLPASGPVAWEVQGRLEGGPASAEVPDRDLRLTERRLAWQGRVAGGPEGPRPAVGGTGRLEGVRLDMPARGVRVAALQELGVDNLALDPAGNADVERVHLAGLLVGATLETDVKDERPPLLTVSDIQLDTVHRGADGAVAVHTIQLDGADASLDRAADGRLRLIGNRLERLAPEAAPEGAGTARPGAGRGGLPPVRVDTLVVTGDSRVQFTDRTVEPPFRATLHLTEARLTGLDSSRPDAPAQLALAARLDDDTDLKLSGSVAPLAPRPSLDLKGTIRKLEMVPLSAYSNHLIGYNLTSGRMDGDLVLKAVHGKLDGKAKLTFRQLNVAPGDTDRMASLSKQLTMPLDAALDLLRDKNGTVKVELPVSGDLEDPSVSVADVVNQALGQGLKAAALTYTKIFLQPFGAVIAVVQLADKATALRLAPLPFAPGAATLGTRDADYAAKVAALLAERPALSLRVCGRATDADRAALPAPPPGTAADPDARLKALAAARADAVKNSLVKAYGVSPSRVYDCLPEIDPDPKGAPRVELLL